MVPSWCYVLLEGCRLVSQSPELRVRLLPVCLQASSCLSPGFFLSVSRLLPVCLQASSCLSPGFSLSVSRLLPVCLQASLSPTAVIASFQVLNPYYILSSCDYAFSHLAWVSQHCPMVMQVCAIVFLSGGPFSGCDPAESEKAVNFDNQQHRIL